MKSALRAAFLIATGLMSGGCQGQLNDIVGSTPPTNPITTVGGDKFPRLKISPGEIRTQSQNLGLKATISPTSTHLTSAQLGVRLGISKVPERASE